MTSTRARACAAMLCVVVAGCRFEIQLDAMHGIDAGAPDAGPPDDGGPSDAGLDAPGHGCTHGVDLVPSPPTGATSAPTLASSGSGETRVLGLLLPPPARIGASDTGLYLLDHEGRMLDAPVELSIDDGSGGEASTATIHGRADAPGFLVLGPRAASLLDESGTGTPITLPLAPLPARQRDAGWIDADHFVYVGSGAGEPLVVLEVSSSSATISALPTEGVARVIVVAGAVVISPTPPDGTIREYDTSLTESFAYTWPGGPLGARLMGATLAGGRRWLANDSQEFRTATDLQSVDADGTTVIATSLIMGPITTQQRGELVTIVPTDGALVVLDFRDDVFHRLLGAGTANSLGLVERDDDDYVTVTREPSATADVLVFRCVTPP